MAQLDPSDRMRIIIEGKKREEQGNLDIRKLAIDLSISRKAVALWWGRRDELDQIGAQNTWKVNIFLWDIESLSGHHNKMCDVIAADMGLGSWHLCVLANTYGGQLI